MNEREWISYLGKFLVENELILRSKDEDCAVIQLSPQHYLLLTTDAMVEGIHFDLSYTDFYSLGVKLAASNLSDIAAMGGEPKYALLTLGSPKPPEIEWCDPLMEGLTQTLMKYRANLVGGDTVRSPFFFFNLALIGETDCPLLRKGAQPEDLIYVSKPLGGSSAFLKAIKNNKIKNLSWELKKAHLQPEPELELGQAIKKIATSAIDISDGLLLDLYRICKVSKVGALIEEEKIPIAKGATLEDALEGGEDYALLFTVPKEKRKALLEVSRKLKKTLFCIGQIIPGEEVIYLKNKKGEIKISPPKGYDHFTSQLQPL